MSTQTEFIKKIGPIIQNLTKKYGYGVNSAIIAQACLESAYGTSGKAKHHNYFGLKYRANRVSCSSGTFVDGSSEQNADGSYVKITDQWFTFASMEKGVEGYLQFIGIPNYDRARAETDPEKYLQALKDAGYATSKAYVQNNMALIKKYNLTQYDITAEKKEVIKVIQKPSIKKKISNAHNYNVGRDGNSIKYIVMHYTGVVTDTAANNATYFAREKLATSAHYFVDSADIYQSVEDSNTAWHCGKNYGSNNLFGKCTNKNSIGIEMCSNHGAITAATINNALLLVKYLMQRYGVPADRVVRHWDVCTKRCPGWSGWLPPDESKWKSFKKQIANGSGTVATQTTTAVVDQKPVKEKTQKLPFLVQVLIPDLNIRKGPGTSYARTGKYTGKGKFTIVEVNKAGDWGKLKSGAGWIYIGNSSYTKKA